MKPAFHAYLRSQGGYTLIEVVIACAIAAVLMSGLSSVILTSVRAASTAASRVQASSQIRNFQFRAYDDFASSGVPVLPAGCGTRSSPCTTQPLTLIGVQVTNSAVPVPSTSQVTYSWDGTEFLDRRVQGHPPRHAATGVSDFSWYLDNSSGNPTIVMSLTVTVPSPNSVGLGSAFLGDPYSESQSLRYYPRLIP